MSRFLPILAIICRGVIIEWKRNGIGKAGPKILKTLLEKLVAEALMFS